MASDDDIRMQKSTITLIFPSISEDIIISAITIIIVVIVVIIMCQYIANLLTVPIDRNMI